MLINKGITQGEVVSVKLNSGEELVARFEEETATGYRISKPTVITMTQQGIGLMPFMFTIDAEKSVIINHSSIAVISLTVKDFADQYLQGTTGIAMR